MMTLTESNYYSPQANRRYMSASQLKSFQDCPARTVAELNGNYRREESTALLVGSYVDAFFSGTIADWVGAHPEILTGKGELRSEYKQANEIIEYLNADPLLTRMLGGEKQKILTGEINGVLFKCKVDSLLSASQCQAIAEDFPEMADTLLMADGAIVDLKVMRDMDAVWVPGAGRQSFVTAWRYDLQLAIYQQVIGNQLAGNRQVVGSKLPCFLVVVTKEKTPDKALIHIPQYMLDMALDEVEASIPAYHMLKEFGSDELWDRRCERCDYCRQSKRVTGAIDADELEGAGL